VATQDVNTVSSGNRAELEAGETTMTYNLSAEGINGVTEKTVIVNNGWANNPPPPNDAFILVVDEMRAASIWRH
jgi:hypothetical protein